MVPSQMPDEVARPADSQVDRLRRLEQLDELLPTLAGVLDIREVFERVSAIARRVLPHDMLALPLLLENRQEVQVYAIAVVRPPPATRSRVAHE
jgi:hypothetical protein